MAEPAHGSAERGRDTLAAPALQAAREDVEDARPWRYRQGDGGGQEEAECGRSGHCVLPGFDLSPPAPSPARGGGDSPVAQRQAGKAGAYSRGTPPSLGEGPGERSVSAYALSPPSGP